MKTLLPLLFGLSSLLVAQEPVEAPPGIPQPGVLPNAEEKPPLPRSIRPAGLADRVLDPTAVVIPTNGSIEEPTLTGIQASELYRKHTGKRVVLTSQASQLQAYFVQPGPLTNAEIAQLLEITLLAEGIAIVPDQVNPNIVRMVASGPVQGVNAAPLNYIDDPLELPLTDQLVTYRMQFENLKPDEALRVFQQVLGTSSPSGSITAVTNASSLIVKENAALIRQLIKLKDDIDIPVKVTESWVSVVYADVDEVAERLNEIYNQRTSNNATTRTRRTAAPLPAGTTAKAAGVAGSTAGEDIPINIIPDARTNRILLVGRPADIAVVTSLIQGYDMPSDGKNDFTYRLKYLRVGDFIPIAYDAIEATLSQGAGGAGGAAGGRLGNQNQNTRGNTNTNRGGNTAGANGAGGGSRTSLQEQEIPTAPEAQIVGGKTLLVADNVANAVIVNGPPHHIEIVRNLIAQLDTAGQQVVISAVIGSYALGKDTNFGIDLAKFVSNSSGDTGGGRITTGTTAGALSAGTLGSLADLLTANGASGNGVSLYGVFNDNFSVFINALEANTDFKTLDRPVVTTKNNRVARISSGRRIAVPASTFNSGVNGGQNTNVEYRDVTLELEVQPLINSDTEVTLEISLVRDALLTTARAIGNGVSVPDISTEELTTSVIAKDGSAIILGGLITEEMTDNKSGVPVLSRIPGIGRLFTNSEKGNNRNELVIILRPQIISNEYDRQNFESGYQSDSSFATQAIEALPPTDGTMLPAKETLEEAPKKSWWSRVTGSGEQQDNGERRAAPPTRSGAGFMKFRRRR